MWCCFSSPPRQTTRPSSTLFHDYYRRYLQHHCVCFDNQQQRPAEPPPPAPLATPAPCATHLLPSIQLCENRLNLRYALYVSPHILGRHKRYRQFRFCACARRFVYRGCHPSSARLRCFSSWNCRRQLRRCCRRHSWRFRHQMLKSRNRRYRRRYRRRRPSLPPSSLPPSSLLPPSQRPSRY